MSPGCSSASTKRGINWLLIRLARAGCGNVCCSILWQGPHHRAEIITRSGFLREADSRAAICGLLYQAISAPGAASAFSTPASDTAKAQLIRTCEASRKPLKRTASMNSLKEYEQRSVFTAYQRMQSADSRRPST